MQLAYRKFGQGQPLIILHGLFGQGDNWNTLAKLFAEQNFGVYALDQRNHGLSPHSEEWNYNVMAEDLKQFIDEHKLQNPILLGHSMGGKAVLFFEYLFPEIANKIIIADMAARFYEPHHTNVLKALNAIDFNIVKSRKEAEAILSNEIPDFGTKQFLLKNIYWTDSEISKMAWRFNLEILTKSFESSGKEIPFFQSDTKVLILKGEKSNYINPTDENEYRKRFSNCTIQIISNAGHWIHAENPKEFFEKVIQFIKV